MVIAAVQPRFFSWSAVGVLLHPHFTEEFFGLSSFALAHDHVWDPRAEHENIRCRLARFIAIILSRKPFEIKDLCAFFYLFGGPVCVERQ